MTGEQEMRLAKVGCCLLALIMVVGCDLTPQPAAVPATAQNSGAGPASAGGMIGIDTGGPVAPVSSTTAPPVDTVKAEVGVGKTGRSLDQNEGLYVTSVKALWSTEEYLAFNVSVVHALDLYEAEHGKRPKTHEEFMQQIIRPNNIRLPELPPGQTYRWDPTQGEKGELMVDPPPKAATQDPVPRPAQP
jgi:hypothetical protein